MNNFWKNAGKQTKLAMQLFLAVATIFFIFLLIPKVNNFEFNYEQGKPWQYNELFSPFDFAILKSEDEVKKDKQELVEKHLNHYVKKEIEQAHFIKLNQLLGARFQQLDSATLFSANKVDLAKMGKVVLTHIYEKGIVEKPTKETIVLVEKNRATKRNAKDFYTLNQAKNWVENYNYSSAVAQKILPSILTMCLSENIVLDKALNQKLIANQLAEVSLTKGIVKEKEKIIGKGEIIDALKYQKLLSFEKKYSEKTLNKNQEYILSIGYFILISIVIVVLVLYLYIYQTHIFNKFNEYALIFLLVNICLLLATLFTQNNTTLIYIMPFTIVPIVMKAFFKKETALYVHLSIILLVALLVSKSYTFAFIQIVAGITALYSNKNVRYWSQFFGAIAFIFVAYIATYIGISLTETGNIQSIEPAILGYLALNAFLSFLAYPLIVFFEKAFGLLSDISLVEYTDLNKPLLKKLSIEAPGTFQHSLQVANLAEAAAAEINANSLLVKVGALYHDIGKMKNRVYFVENQFPEQNPHDALSCEQSAKIIIAHVTDGVKMAKKNGIPEQIIEFIKTHHGTTRVEYFYRMQAKLQEDETIDEQNFVYPGPAPFKKEHAILMMADSVEAASKSLKNPTSESLSNLVDKIINYQQERGQFDNVPITLQEISCCKTIFKKMLASIYHIRIEYPK